MNKKNWLIATLILFILTSSFTPAGLCLRQGIKGKAVRVSGNRMPSPDIPLPEPKPISTTIYIFEITNIKQVVRQENTSFYTAVNSNLVKKAESNNKGAFKIKLKPGLYSVFTKKGDLYYANTFDQDNNIAPVKVEKGKYTDLEIRIDYDAVY